MISPAWKLCERLSIRQAVLLICGYDPASYQNKSLDDLAVSLPHVLPVREALIAVIRERRDFGELLHYDGNAEYCIDLDDSYVRVEPLREWLGEKGVVDNFFSDPVHTTPSYLKPDHPRYSPHLAAAVAAWEALASPQELSGKSPKKALDKWLRENAADFGLTHEDGKPNETAIDRVAMVANWQPQGGAPVSSVGSEDSVYPKISYDEPIRLAPPVDYGSALEAKTKADATFTIDDEIPF